MSEPSWELLGGGGVAGPAGIAYMGAWAAGTAYQPGQVVRYNGVDYLAVNASTGQTPPAATLAAVAYGTSLPVSPFDGQEAVLVDSITNPTYQWRFRYNAGSSSAYKWEFIGGAKWTIQPADWTMTGLAAWQVPSTGLQTISFPRSGDYDAEGLCTVNAPAASGQIASLTIDGSTSPPVQFNAYVASASTSTGISARRTVLAINAGQVVSQAFYSLISLGTFANRFVSVTPRRVA